MRYFKMPIIVQNFYPKNTYVKYFRHTNANYSDYLLFALAKWRNVGELIPQDYCCLKFTAHWLL